MRARIEEKLRWLAAGALCAGLVAVAHAYLLITDDSGIYAINWQPGTVTMRLMLPDPAFALADGGTYASSVQAAIQTWNAKIGVVQLAADVRAAGTRRGGNRINEVVMASSVGGVAFDSNTLAVTLSYTDANTRIESDIVFNTAYTWDSYRGVRAGHGGRVDIQRVVIHELGHVLGLDHPDEDTPPQSVVAIMNSRISDIDTLQEDDITGGRLLYGASGALPANDNFVNAIAINLTATATTLRGATIGSTKESGEPAHATSTTVKTSWWKWTAPSNGSTTITTLGSDFDTVLAVYTGTAVSALTPVVSNDDVNPGVVRTSAVTFNAVGGTTYDIAVGGWDEFYGNVQLNLSFDGTLPVLPPAISVQPGSATAIAGGGASFSVSASGAGALTYQWLFDGQPIAGATGTTYAIAFVDPANAGQYAVRVTDANGSTTSAAATLGVTISTRLAGAASEVQSNVTHPNGNVYDQLLLTGSSASGRADAGQIVRMSYIDLSDDIVQVEFSGAGTLTLTLESGATGPAVPVNYNQSTTYMRGHARIVVAGADETSNLSVFSVGRMTAFDPTGAYDVTKPAGVGNDPAKNGNPLFKSTVNYDGFADIASISILSANGKFGGLRTSNASYFAAAGLTGVYAPGVEFVGPVFIGDISASDAAQPVIRLGAASDVRITGGDLLQANGQPVQVSGFSQLKFAAGQNSHGTLIPAQANKAKLEQDGVDVTSQIVSGP